MSNNNTPPWEYKENFHKIPMSDDYDGHYEVTNGDISLCTGDDPEDITETENTLQRVAKALNESGCKFYCNTTTEHKLHIENLELRYKADELKARCEKMDTALLKLNAEIDKTWNECNTKSIPDKYKKSISEAQAICGAALALHEGIKKEGEDAKE